VVLWIIIRTAVASTTSATFVAYFSCVLCVCYVISCVRWMETPLKSDRWKAVCNFVAYYFIFFTRISHKHLA